MNHLKESKLIDIVKLLSKKEFKELGVWLQSPWSQNNKHFSPFYQILVNSAHNFTSNDLQKEKVFLTLFPEKKYNNRTFNNLILAFTKEVENYLSHLQLNLEKQQKQQLLGKAFLSRKRADYFEDAHQKLIEEVVLKKEKTSSDYLLLKQLYHELYFQTSTHHRYDPKSLFLEQASDNLDAFYLLERYNYLHEQAARTKILKLPPQKANKPIRALLNHLQQQLQLPAATLYGFRIKTKLVHNWSDYLIFKKLFLNVHAALPFSLRQNFLFFCINDVVDFNSRGEDSAIEELYNWYKFGLSNNLLVQNDMITAITYNNIILTACHLYKYDFLRAFIADYSKRLPKKKQAIGIRWSKAHLEYALGNYDSAIEDLKDWLPKDKFFAIQVKATLLKANFKELMQNESHSNLFKSYCLSYERYIKRNKLYSEHRTTAYLKYIQYLRKVAQLAYAKSSPNQWENLLKDIQTEPVLFGKNWLETEIDLIRKGKKKEVTNK